LQAFFASTPARNLYTNDMLARVHLKQRPFAAYKPYVAAELYDEVIGLATGLAGKRILQINATADGGGVAEILSATVSILVGLGVEVEWDVLVPETGFFNITKTIHNGLQGNAAELTLEQWELYQNYNRRLAESFDANQWDLVVMHDPQPAAMLGYLSDRGKTKWVWRCHIDSRHALADYKQRFLTYLKPYDGLVFTMKKFVLEGLTPRHLAIIPMAIDPLSPKNHQLEMGEAKAIVAKFGVDPMQPLAVQVSRFDPWKDPLGVVGAWQKAKQTVPSLQLALVGDTASDDPQSAEILEQVKRLTQGMKDLYIIANQADAKTVNAFQTAATVVLQKSLREGFGLTVSEALWAGTPVVGGNVGGIALQIESGTNGYLVESVDEAANYLAELASNPAKARQMGLAGHEKVKEQFLLPRLLRDDLRFWTELIKS
jgi:trehalose synthase